MRSNREITCQLICHPCRSILPRPRMYPRSSDSSCRTNLFAYWRLLRAQSWTRKPRDARIERRTATIVSMMCQDLGWLIWAYMQRSSSLRIFLKWRSLSTCEQLLQSSYIPFHTIVENFRIVRYHSIRAKALVLSLPRLHHPQLESPGTYPFRQGKRHGSCCNKSVGGKGIWKQTGHQIHAGEGLELVALADSLTWRKATWLFSHFVIVFLVNIFIKFNIIY